LLSPPSAKLSFGTNENLKELGWVYCSMALQLFPSMAEKG